MRGKEGAAVSCAHEVDQTGAGRWSRQRAELERLGGLQARGPIRAGSEPEEHSPLAQNRQRIGRVPLGDRVQISSLVRVSITQNAPEEITHGRLRAA